MNCDQVFDILTRGPFPTGTSCDPPVESHLTVCAECRRLAEALRPALELFQEAISPEESRDLPGYWCALSAEPQQPAVSYAREVAPRRAAPPRRWVRTRMAKNFSALTAWRMVAMLALGVTVGSLVSSRMALDRLGTAPPAGSGPAIGTTLEDDQPRLTASQRAEWAALPAACFGFKPDKGPRNSLRGDRLLADADLSNLICCSECHNAASDAVPSAATKKVARSCQACHEHGHSPAVSMAR